jgi:hypothetical protein
VPQLSQKVGNILLSSLILRAIFVHVVFLFWYLRGHILAFMPVRVGNKTLRLLIEDPTSRLLGVTIPILKPYVTGGWAMQYRTFDVAVPSRTPCLGIPAQI